MQPPPFPHFTQHDEHNPLSAPWQQQHHVYPTGHHTRVQGIRAEDNIIPVTICCRSKGKGGGRPRWDIELPRGPVAGQGGRGQAIWSELLQRILALIVMLTSQGWGVKPTGLVNALSQHTSGDQTKVYAAATAGPAVPCISQGRAHEARGSKLTASPDWQQTAILPSGETGRGGGGEKCDPATVLPADEFGTRHSRLCQLSAVLLVGGHAPWHAHPTTGWTLTP